MTLRDRLHRLERAIPDKQRELDERLERILADPGVQEHLARCDQWLIEQGLTLEAAVMAGVGPPFASPDLLPIFLEGELAVARLQSRGRRARVE